MKWLGIKKEGYRKFQSLPDEKILKELGKIMNYLTKRKKFSRFKKVILIDAHFINVRNGKAQNWVGDWLSVMDGLVLVKAAPTEILKRMESDEKKSSRQRNIFTTNAGYSRKIELLGFSIGKVSRYSKNVSE